MSIQYQKLNPKKHRYTDVLKNINYMARYETSYQPPKLNKFLREQGYPYREDRIINPDVIFFKLIKQALNEGYITGEGDITQVFLPFPNALYEEGDHDVYVAKIGSGSPNLLNVIGYSTFTFLDDNNRAFKPVLTQIYVHPKFRRQGIAMSMLEYAIKDKSLVKLYVECPNSGMVEILRKVPHLLNCSVETGEIEMDFSSSVPKISDWIKWEAYY